MPKAQSKGCQRKNKIQQGPGVNEQQIDSEDKEGDLQDSCSTVAKLLGKPDDIVYVASY